MSVLNEMRRIADAAVLQSGKPRHGIVSAVDPINHAAKVMIQPENVESGWIAVGCTAAGTIRIARVPDIGEHVTVNAMEGDAEHLVVIAGQFDTITTPPVSPATGKTAQPGEILIMAGCASPPPNAADTAPGSTTPNAPWWHMTATSLFAGVGNATVTVTNGGITWTVGAHTMTMTDGGLVSNKDATFSGTVIGQTDVKTSEHDLNTHVHTNGNDGANTGGPVG